MFRGQASDRSAAGSRSPFIFLSRFFFISAPSNQGSLGTGNSRKNKGLLRPFRRACSSRTLFLREDFPPFAPGPFPANIADSVVQLKVVPQASPRNRSESSRYSFLNNIRAVKRMRSILYSRVAIAFPYSKKAFCSGVSFIFLILFFFRQLRVPDVRPEAPLLLVHLVLVLEDIFVLLNQRALLFFRGKKEHDLRGVSLPPSIRPS